MNFDVLPQIDEQAGPLVDEVAASDAGRWKVWGGVSVGKSTFLTRLGSLLRAKGLHPLLLTPPAGDLDAGLVGFVQLTSQLANGAPNADEVEQLIRSQKRTLTEKVTTVREWLEAGRDKVVILCDEPDTWLRGSYDTDHFQETVSAMHRLALDTPGVRAVVAGALPDGRSVRRSIKLEARLYPDPSLSESSGWGAELQEAARKLSQEVGAAPLPTTALALRLMVGLTAMGIEPHRLGRLQRPQLAELLREKTQESEWKALGQAWAKLALIREPFDKALLQILNAPPAETLSGEILRSCLLFEEAGELVLHPMLRSDALDILNTAERTATHNKIAVDYYQPRFSAAVSPPSTSTPVTRDLPRILAYEMEAFHHFSASGQESSNLQPLFAEQLDLYGRHLSEVLKRYQQAAGVFQRALAWDDDDDYAHHYLAYNLDILAQEPDRIQGHYEKAVELRRHHPWWWSRWIGFLLARGQIVEAERVWSLALDEFPSQPNSDESKVYRDLHGQVLSISLTRGQLGLAARILDAIPAEYISRDNVLNACRRYFLALERARHSQALVPLPYLGNEAWWKDGPFRLSHTLHANPPYRLVRWLPARVETIDQETAHLKFGEIEIDNPTEPKPGLWPVALSELSEWSINHLILKAGDYLEIGCYESGQNDQTKVMIHEGTQPEHEFEWLNRLHPNPDRYLAGCQTF